MRPSPAPPAAAGNREPVSVLIADFDNQAKEPVFEGSLEQALSIAIEGASFITSYPRASAQTSRNQLKPGSKLDESGARLVAAREGIKIVMTGTVATRGSGYTLTVKAVDRRPARCWRRLTRRCADKAGVLAASSGSVDSCATRSATRRRKAPAVRQPKR